MGHSITRKYRDSDFCNVCRKPDCMEHEVRPRGAKPKFDLNVMPLVVPPQPGQFSTLLVDIPWKFNESTSIHAPGGKYPCMSLKDVHELPIGALAADRAHLWMWTPHTFLLNAQCRRLMRWWGFEPVQVVPWIKTTLDGYKVRGKPGQYMLCRAEYLVLGVRGPDPRPEERSQIINVIVDARVEHSRKPEQQYEIVETVSPGPFIELFARRTRDNWVSLGNEIDGRDIRTALRDYI